VNVVAVKRELIRLLADLPGLDGVQVAYAFTADIDPDCVYGGDISGPVSAVAFRGGQRLPRLEDALLRLHVRVDRDGQAIEETEARAAEIGAAVTDYLAANPTLSDFPGLKQIGVGDFDMSSAADDDGSITTLAYQLAVRSILT
jgi:hypothetical protein